MNKFVYPFIVYEYYIIEAFKPVGGLQRQIKASDCKRKGMEECVIIATGRTGKVFPAEMILKRKGTRPISEAARIKIPMRQPRRLCFHPAADTIMLNRPI